MNKVQSPSGTVCTGKKLFWLLMLAILSVSLAARGYARGGNSDEDEESTESQVTDFRTFVEIPDKPRKILQEDMLDHLAALNEINRYLADNNLASAADVAESGMGRSLLSKYQNEGMRPGRYMPKEMREIGYELHAAASQFAKVARQGNLQETLHAYHRITSACVACHYSYRTR
jgi:hypothetical protein